MKDDYLWDKTGSDPDIERLEEVLSTFRYQDPSGKTAVIVPFRAKAERNIKPWIYAIAACIAVAAVSAGIWNFAPGRGTQGPAQHIAFDTTSENGPAEPIAKESPRQNIDKVEKIATVPDRAVQIQRKPRRAYSPAAAAKQPVKRSRPSFTEEEKYAYNQLMLALAITSSKLQLVQDTINGIEEDQINNR